MRLTRSGTSPMFEALVKQAQIPDLPDVPKEVSPLVEQEPQEFLSGPEQAELEEREEDTEPLRLVERMLSRIQAGTAEMGSLESDLIALKGLLGEKEEDSPEPPMPTEEVPF